MSVSWDIIPATMDMYKYMYVYIYIYSNKIYSNYVNVYVCLHILCVYLSIYLPIIHLMMNLSKTSIIFHRSHTNDGSTAPSRPP